MSTEDKIDVAKLAAASRREYAGDSLTLAASPAEPFSLFGKWLEAAIQHADIRDGNAMCLSTVDKAGLPHSRMVLLKDVEYGEEDYVGTQGKDQQSPRDNWQDNREGFVFYTNYDSAKGADIAENPAIALNFWWPPMHRQVRVEGRASKLSPEKSKKYFDTRDRASRIGAWASPQSNQIHDYDELISGFKKVEEKFDGKEVPLPPHWGGYIVNPTQVEFWQGSRSRLHMRIIYSRSALGDSKDANAWDKRMLAP